MTSQNSQFVAVVVAVSMLVGSTPRRCDGANPVVPGSGLKLAQVGDDFEDSAWEFMPNLPKSSEELDKRQRLPAGVSANARWYEGMKRGCPDVAVRVATPADGIAGSEGSLLMRSIRTGIPGAPSYEMQQDDFVANVWQRLGGKIPVRHTPSVVVRVFLPPAKTWERRTGPTFGFRASLETHAWKVPEDATWVKKKEYQLEPYWPGIFVEFQPAKPTHGAQEKAAPDLAFWRIRGNTRGGEVRGPGIDTSGWWTLGMSFTPEGMVHYYIRRGVEDLTAGDYVTSQYPYGYRAETFKTFFFNVCNRDDGRTKSTDWVIDDPAVYVLTSPPSMARTNVAGREAIDTRHDGS